MGGRPLLSWSQIQELASHGIQIDADSCTDPTLTDISASEAKEEIIDSQKHLESKLGLVVNLFAYPYGAYDLSIQNMARQAEYVAGCTADAGLNTVLSPSFTLRRTEIQENESITRFLLALWTGHAEVLWWRRKRKNHK